MAPLVLGLTYDVVGSFRGLDTISAHVDTMRAPALINPSRCDESRV